MLRELAFALNMTGFGAGVFMYVGLLALTMARHFLGAPVEGKMTPTLWVHLAPLSVIPLSMLALLKTTATPRFCATAPSSRPPSSAPPSGGSCSPSP